MIVAFINWSSLEAQYEDLAWHNFNNEAYVEASENFLKIFKKDKKVLKALGDCYYYIGDLKNATIWYEKFIAEHSDSITSEMLFRYSQALYGTKNRNKAILWFNRYKDLMGIDGIELGSIDENLINNPANNQWQLYRLDTNTDNSEFGGAFYQQNKFVFAAPAKKGALYAWNEERYLDLYESTIDGNGFLTEIKPLSENINSKWHESSATFTKDGKTVYFTTNVSDGNNKSKNTKNDLNILRASKIDSTWGNATPLTINLEGYITEHPALNEDGTKLYFASDRPGGFGSLDLYVVDIFENGTFGKPKNLGPQINTDRREQFPFVSNDSLYFASDGHLGLGGLDIFKSYIQNNLYSRPENLKRAINSELDDFAFVKNDSLNIGYISSNRYGSDDIFLIEKSVLEYIIQVELRDRKNNNFINNAVVKLYLEDKEIFKKKSREGINTFIISSGAKGNYKIGVQHEFYQSVSAVLTPEQVLGEEMVVVYLDGYIEIEKEIVKKNNKIQIDHDPIFFDANSSYFTNKNEKSLEGIINILNKYPDMSIRCESHTDSRESDNYNQWLSERRAKRTADYIISKGIDVSRVSWKGFGETQILNRCTNAIQCSDDEHGVNRRTEFVLIAKSE